MSGEQSLRGQPNCWKMRTTLERLLIVTTTVATVASLVAIFHLLNNGGSTYQEATVCETEECVAVAHQMLINMDSSVQPCDNFYKYACGGWDRRNRVDDNSKSITVHQLTMDEDKVINELFESDWKVASDDLRVTFNQMKTLYRSCMDDSLIKQIGFLPGIHFIAGSVPGNRNILEVLLDILGGISEVNSNEMQTRLNLSETLAQLLLIGETPLFDVGLQVDHYNSSKLIILISLPSLSSIPAASTYQQDNVTDTDEIKYKLYDRIKAHVDDKLNEGIHNILTNYFGKRQTNDRSLLNRLKQLEKHLRMIVPSPKKLKKLHEVDVQMTIKRLQRTFKLVDWKYLLGVLFERTFDDDHVVEVTSPKYMKQLDDLLRTYSARDVTNALLVLFARDQLFDLVTLDAYTERWRYCVNTVKKYLPAPLSLVYMETVPKTLQSLTQRHATELFEQLKQIFKLRITNSKWMSSPSKSQAIDKVNKMKANFGEVHILSNDPIFTKLLSVSLNETMFFENAIALSIKNRENERSFYRQNLSRNQIEMYFGLAKHYVVNAFNLHSFNKIVFNLGILKPPYFYLNVPNFVTYGSLGATMGHEMQHAFDTTGVTYDGSGNRNKWLTLQDELALRNINNCFARWFADAFEKTFAGFEDVQLTLDGDYTLNENIADNGIDVAYEAYKAWASKHPVEPKLPGISLTAEQIFFLSAAQTSCSVLSLTDYVLSLELDEHTPEPERVNSYLMNSGEFAKVFGCHPTSRMNPIDKCSFW